MKRPPRVCLGVIVGVKGLRGEVRIKSFTEDPADVAAYGPLTSDDGRTFALTVTGQASGAVIAKVKGVTDRNAAEALKGLELWITRSALPAAEEGAYYHADLIGLAVSLATGEALGEVAAVHNFGGGDMIDVRRADGRSDLIPFTPEVLAKVDLAEGVIVINPLPGLLDEGETKEDEEGQEAEEDVR